MESTRSGPLVIIRCICQYSRPGLGIAIATTTTMLAMAGMIVALGRCGTVTDQAGGMPK